MSRGSFNIRKSLARLSGSSISHNILALSMDEHHQQIQQVFSNFMTELFDSKLPKALQKAQLVKKSQEIETDKIKERAEDIVSRQLDKFEVYSNDNIFGRKELVDIDRRLNAQRQNKELLVKKILKAMEEVMMYETQLALAREGRKYRTRLAGSLPVKKAPKVTAKQLDIDRQLSRKTDHCLEELDRIAKEDKKMYSNFLKEANLE